mgnify:CR=1 FL=1
MELEIKCLECGKRTRRFEIGPAVFTADGCKEILLRDPIICPKCKHDISNGKCITPSGMFMITLMAIIIGMKEKKDGGFEIHPHLKGLAIVTKENYEMLKKQSKASIKLAAKLNNYSEGVSQND